MVLVGCLARHGSSIERGHDLGIISAGDLPFVPSHLKFQNANAVLEKLSWA
jgi:hypothetical protein